MPLSGAKTNLTDQQHLRLHQNCQQLVQEVNLDSLKTKLLKVACQEVEAHYAILLLMDKKETIQQVVPFGLSAEERELVQRKSQELTAISSAISANRSIKISDVGSDSNRDYFYALHPPMRSFLGVTLSVGTTCQGQLLLWNSTGLHEFSDEDLKAGEILARYAAIAIKNARMNEDLALRDRVLTRRYENMALLDRLASTLATSTDIDQIITKGLVQLMEYLRLDIGEIYLRQKDSKNVILTFHQGEGNNHLWKRDQFVVGEGAVGKIFTTGRPVVIDLYKQQVPDLDPKACEAGVMHLAIVPLTGRKGVLGAMCVASCHQQPLDELEVQFLQAICSWMATAIENVYLNVQGRRLAVLEERERIGMDLHDGIIQSIYAVGLTLQHAHLLINENVEQSSKRIEQSINDLNSIIRDIRAYILDLRPRQLHNEDLMSGLGRLVAEFKANTLLDVNLQGPTEDISNLPKNQAVALFHICQEALANIAKHAHAHRVDVVVWTTNDRMLMEVRDDGEGFDSAKIHVSIGHGLSNMETRITNVGGEVDITSEPGKGTSILAWVPLPEDEDLVIE
jgi:signal transduction histidine kinase